MATLMSVGDNYGERRCDERCYGASGGKCSCVCGGMNHGVGLRVAMNNTREYGKKLLEKIKEENPKVWATINDIQEVLEL